VRRLFTDVRETTAAATVDPESLGAVEDEAMREQYAAEAKRLAETHDPDDVI